MERYPQRPLQFTPRLPEEMLARAEQFRALMQQRRSVRTFSSRPVPRELIEQAILTAGTAPSGAHREPWHFVAVNDPRIQSEIRRAAEKEERESYKRRMSKEWLDALHPLGTDWNKPFLEMAPWLVVCFAKNIGDDGMKNYYVQESCGIACGLFIAAIHNMGLVTLTHTPSPMRFLGDILKRPKHERAYILFPVGYPAEGVMVPDLKRKSQEQLVTWQERD
ncbi:MAG: nitroreductase family protein [Rhodothermaceae bacterium]|nr:nitroreductase family protein [Rhodothermaceae bacterium]MXZ56906.1 nitroreductase family protein [Rhodothermaceae bacterium]MYB91453.1 nitroreductase family protein [Rhodothermaceae bacterium]MYD67845.1 nitroreductase family protein [Rhodothermaceae bacterium]MYG43564.1 nitroreductase family protein [Rhodothermaceae bacterium]